MADLTPLLAFRWSPRAFDPAAELAPAEAASLLEAARWAPSVGNGQPWRFALGHRDDETQKRILANLPATEQRWARHAAALLLGAHVRPDPTGTAASPTGTASPTGHASPAGLAGRTPCAGDASPAGLAGRTPCAGDASPAGSAGAASSLLGGREAYDLGQAVAHLTVQATALGLYVRQILGFDHAGLADDLELPAGVHPLVVVAVGRLGDPFSLPEELRHHETGLRRRRPLADLLLR
ncbi:nitroreductase family protein [Micromonospora sp. DT233]|uniref:nitroreductase family protein n=1 Tax=Micromonospora sp. DT233 TaxID=3393432 RepID=UPI003CE7C97A